MQGEARQVSLRPMKKLLIVTAVIESGAGAALLCCPSATVAILLGAWQTGLISSPTVTLGRVAGVALFALGVACWLARYDVQSCAARGLVGAMVLYNLGVAVVLGVVGIASRPVGVALWPVIVLHAAMTAWCVTCLVSKRK